MARKYITANNLGIMMDYHESLLFQWFLALCFFGKRIQQNIADFSQKLQQLKGVGPKTAEIFLREAAPRLVCHGNNT